MVKQPYLLLFYVIVCHFSMNDTGGMEFEKKKMTKYDMGEAGGGGSNNAIFPMTLF